jgi:hypothetical protein
MCDWALSWRGITPSISRPGHFLCLQEVQRSNCKARPVLQVGHQAVAALFLYIHSRPAGINQNDVGTHVTVIVNSLLTVERHSNDIDTHLVQFVFNETKCTTKSFKALSTGFNLKNVVVTIRTTRFNTKIFALYL